MPYARCRCVCVQSWPGVAGVMVTLHSLHPAGITAVVVTVVVAALEASVVAAVKAAVLAAEVAVVAAEVAAIDLVI